MVPTRIIIMTDAMLTLMTWFSPAYPVGAFSYSHGIEWAVEAGDVTDRASLRDWIVDCMRYGAGWNDAVVLAHCWRSGEAHERAELIDLARALQPSKERSLESEAQGAAFAKITASTWAAEGIEDVSLPYPVAVGFAARAHNLPLIATLRAYLAAFAANLVSAGVRLVPLGQTDGQRIQAALLAECELLAKHACTASLDDIGGCAFRADIAAMLHETQHTRLFRT